jgi:hypothetical protein
MSVMKQPALSLHTLGLLALLELPVHPSNSTPNPQLCKTQTLQLDHNQHLHLLRQRVTQLLLQPLASLQKTQASSKVRLWL